MSRTSAGLKSVRRCLVASLIVTSLSSCDSARPTAPLDIRQDSLSPLPTPGNSLSPEEANIFDQCNIQGVDQCHRNPLQFSSLTSNTPTNLNCPYGCHSWPLYDSDWGNQLVAAMSLFSTAQECSWAKPYLMNLYRNGRIRFFEYGDGGIADTHLSSPIGSTSDYKAQIHLRTDLFTYYGPDVLAHVLFHEAWHGYFRNVTDNYAAEMEAKACMPTADYPTP